MKKTFIYWMVLSLVVTVDCFSKTAPDTEEQTLTIKDAVQSFEQGAKANKNNISVVNLHGTWYEMGRQFGNLMQNELNEVYEFIHDLIETGTVNAGKATAVVDREVLQTPYRIAEFMRGASETSGLSVRQLQVVNALERISGLPQCSAAFCWGDYAAGPLVIGRNYDYNSLLSKLKNDIAVTVYHPSDGALAVATIGYVGEIYAVNGLNEKGIFLELNNGTPSCKEKPAATRVTSTTMLLSALFETDELADWELFFNTIGCSSSYIINMADNQKGASYEWCPIGAKHGESTLPDGLMVSTNYFVNTDWLFPTPSDVACWEGITRRNNLITLCEASKGTIDFQKMKQIIETPLEDGGAMNPLTVYQMVVIPETQTLWLHVIGGSDWLRIELSEFLLQGTTSIAQIKSSSQSDALTIRPGKGGLVRLCFNQAPKKTMNVAVYNVSGSKLCQHTISPTGAVTYTIEVPKAKKGVHIVRVNSLETGLSGSGVISW